jgi:hypothetical protein
MPNLVKIGYTMKDPRLRARDFEQTGVPHSYAVEFDVLVENPRDLEQRTHRRLSTSHENKEWFRCSATEAISTIRELLGGEGLLESTQKTTNKGEGAGIRQRRSSTTLNGARSEFEVQEIQAEIVQNFTISLNNCPESAAKPSATRKPDNLNNRSEGTAKPSATGVLDKRIRFSAAYSDHCQHCGALISVTITRHDDCTICPACHEHNDLREFVKRELPY